MTSQRNVNQVPTFSALMNPTLDAIRALGSSGSIQEIANRVIEDLELPEDVTQLLHKEGPQTEVEYRLAWSRSYLKKYGLIDN